MQRVQCFAAFLHNGWISSSPITLLQEVAFLLTAKLLVSLQLVHAVATLLTLRVLHKPTQHYLTPRYTRALLTDMQHRHKHTTNSPSNIEITGSPHKIIVKNDNRKITRHALQHVYRAKPIYCQAEKKRKMLACSTCTNTYSSRLDSRQAVGKEGRYSGEVWKI